METQRKMDLLGWSCQPAQIKIRISTPTRRSSRTTGAECTNDSSGKHREEEVKRANAQRDKCKAGFPCTHLKTDRHVLVCRGVAKRFQLRISGRKNAFGSMVGKRSCEWQSGTTPAFAVVFRSNTHTLPNYRAPILPETHETDLCRSRHCRVAMQDPRETKLMAKMTQMAWRSEMPIWRITSVSSCSFV